GRPRASPISALCGFLAPVCCPRARCGQPNGVGWPAGLVFALACAFASSVSGLMRYRGATAAPAIEPRRPLRTVVALFRERWWTLGYGVAIVAWLLHVTALKLAPLSLVQAAMASSFVFLGVA